MESSTRNKRIRFLVRKLNRARKEQEKKLDIVCNDLIEAHRSFIKRLEIIHHSAMLFESLIGVNELCEVSNIILQFLIDKIKAGRVSIFIKLRDRFEYCAGPTDPYYDVYRLLEDALSQELINDICKIGAPCDLNELLSMGLQVSPNISQEINVLAYPLKSEARTTGFILLQNEKEKEFSQEDIHFLSAITPAISKAARCCGVSVF